MPASPCPADEHPATPARHRHPRDLLVAHLAAWRASGDSQRAYAAAVGLSPSTLRDWAHLHDSDTDPHLVRFFDTPRGLALLHRIFTAAILVMNLQGNCGLRLVQTFFQLAGLSPFLACSYGTIQQHSERLHSLVDDFGKQQCRELAKTMPHKRIVVCEDETFPASGMTLVAMEPVSNFIIAETVTPDRTACTWNRVLQQGIDGYNVEVIAQCSDQAAGLLAHATAVGVPHDPDLFHVGHDINRALVLHLERARRAADEAGDQAASSKVEQWQQTRAAAVSLIGESYHPYNVWTGAPQTAATVDDALQTAFSDLDRVAEQSGASARGIERLAKARRVVPQMVLAVSWYHEQVQQALDEAALPEELQQYLERVALPAAYLQRVAAAAPTAADRQRLDALAQTLRGGQPDRVAALRGSERVRVERLVSECVGWFCRGSSCVEGRNGVLALRQHAHRRLPPARRAALTVAHNFLSRRADGSTAASRFFEQPHPDLFEWVLQRMPVPPRPGPPRVKRVTEPLPVA